MTQSIPSPVEQPLVTFALFAYNQEEFIREAVEGAFAQSYEPLEIILSDDCSSDRTFEIMQEMAADYRGRHKVRARQSPRNRGTLGHVLDVAHEAKGEFLVVAAGDDVSLPHRTERLAAALTESGAVAVSSNATRLDGKGGGTWFRDMKSINNAYAYEIPVRRIHGATAAYSPDFLRGVEISDDGLLFEDICFELITKFLDKKVLFLNECLIFYRVRETISNNLSYNGLSEFEIHRLEQHRKIFLVIRPLIEFLESKRIESHFFYKLKKVPHFYKDASYLRDMNLIDRLRLLCRAPSMRSFRWLLPKVVLPWNVFVFMKLMRDQSRERRSRRGQAA